MVHHAAFGKNFSALDIAIIDSNSALLQVVEAIAKGLGVARVRTFEDPERALVDLSRSPPDLVLTTWLTRPIDGCSVVRAMRHRDMEPLCRVAAIISAPQPNRRFIETAFRAGAQQFMREPVTPSGLYRRLCWLVADARQLVLRGDRYVIDGIDIVLAAADQRRPLTRGQHARDEQDGQHQSDPVLD